MLEYGERGKQCNDVDKLCIIFLSSLSFDEIDNFTTNKLFFVNSICHEQNFTKWKKYQINNCHKKNYG